MKIEIESRKSIEKRATEPFSPYTALISITDMDYEFAELKNKPQYLLQLEFDDISDADLDTLYHDNPEIKDTLIPENCVNMFNDEQAVKIAEFIKSIFGKAELLICQCEYGQSRSAGLAAAVRQFLYGDGIEIFADDEYYPNKLVYRKVLEKLNEI